MSDEKMMRLMRELDGESEGAGADAIAKTPRTQEDEARVAAMREIGDAVRASVEAHAQEAELDLWSTIASRIESHQAATAASKQAATRSWRSRVRSRAMSISVAAAAATLAILVMSRPIGRGEPTDGCDIEALEVDGALASVLTVGDAHEEGAATVIWLDDEADDQADDEEEEEN